MLPEYLCSAHGKKLCRLLSFLCSHIHSFLFGSAKGCSGLQLCIGAKACAGTRQKEAIHFAILGCTCTKQTVSDSKPLQLCNVLAQTKGQFLLAGFVSYHSGPK